MSALPSAVQKQIDRANQLADDYQKSLQGDGQPPADGTPPADAGAAAPVTPTGDGQPPAPAPLPVEGWEQKYRVLQGKYNAEVPRLQTQVRESVGRLQNLEQQLTATQNLLASLGAQRAADPASKEPPATPAAPPKLVKDEEVREFGADLIDLMRRVSREENVTLLPEIDRRMAPVSQRVDQAMQTAAQVGQRITRSDEQGVITALATEVPDWEKLNEDPNFLEWLDQIDPFSGKQRGTLLQQAYKAHDGSRVVAFFKGFLKEHAAVSPPGSSAAGNRQPAPQKNLNDFVAPGTQRAAAGTQDGSGKRVWTRAEISKFYADRAALRYNTESGKKRAAEMEADIFAAQREGRVR